MHTEGGQNILFKLSEHIMVMLLVEGNVVTLITTDEEPGGALI